MSLWTFALVWLLLSSAVLVLVAWIDDALARRHANRPRAPREPSGDVR